MRRPYRALCGMVLVAAVVMGCKKKSPDTGTPAPADAAASASPVPPASGGPARLPADKTPPVPIPPAGPSDVLTPGKVELVQCRFTAIETALSASKGKVVLVDCWARWCPPCISSFPKLVEKSEKYSPKGLVCMSVSLDGGRKQFTTDQVQAFLTDKKATFRNFYLTDLQADNAAMERRFGKISGIPHAVLFDRKGEKVWEGHPMDNGLVGRIEAELAKPAPSTAG